MSKMGDGPVARAVKAERRRRNPTCMICGMRPTVQGHHSRYPPDEETCLDDVISVCIPCHYMATTLRRAERQGVSIERVYDEFQMAVERLFADGTGRTTPRAEQVAQTMGAKQPVRDRTAGAAASVGPRVSASSQPKRRRHKGGAVAVGRVSLAEQPKRL